MSIQQILTPAYPYPDQLTETNSSRTFSFNQDAMNGLNGFDRILFERFGQGPRELAPFECVHHAIEHQAKQQPEVIAATHGNQVITYRQLDQQANHLANKLREMNVSSGDHVGIFTRRSVSMLVSMLACMKAGAAYVPLDASIAPQPQMEYVISTAGVRVVLTSESCLGFLPESGDNSIIAVDTFLEDIQARSENLSSLPPRNTKPGQGDQICFVLFTSGTTGKPNGVQVSHGNLCNILLTAPGNLGMKPGLKVSQVLNIAFDMSAWEILGCLSNGATLVIRENSMEAAMSEADIVIATPSVLASVNADAVRPIKAAAVAGEPCPRTLADKWAGFCAFYNSCGPTETTIINTAQRHHPESKHLSIGMPTPNNTVYILDADMNPCPIGEVGEMWAGGDCVSKGYLANEELTAERYQPDPFLGNGRMMFRTRDLGRWTREGQLEHLGRTDDQVKVRGFRVELDSVSGLMETLPECKRAVTLKLNSRDLVAFVSPKTVDVERVRKQITSHLPYYCEPKYIFTLDELPLTERGKVNKRLLLNSTQQLIEQENTRLTAKEGVLPC